MRWLILLLLVMFACLSDSARARPAALPPGLELLLCGEEEVFVLRLDPEGLHRPEKLWSWRAADRPELPDSVKGWFGTTDDCKPLTEGRVLITSSGGGAALVDREGRVLFWGAAANAHSAELLPGDRVAVAASHVPDGSGDALLIYAPGLPGELLERHELSWGHGVFWDSERGLLYALADQEIRIFRPRGDDSARFEPVEDVPLPEGGGHDLYPVPGTSLLTITTAGRCWYFDRESRELGPHPLLGDLPRIKGICETARGQLAWTQAFTTEWWTDTVHFQGAHGGRPLRLPDQHLYKVRWVDWERWQAPTP